MKSLLNIIKKNPFYETLFHSKYYLISNLAVKGLGIISLPVMTRLLLPSDYGLLSVFNGYNAILISILTLNCYVALGRYYYEGQNDFKEFFGTSVIFVLSLLFISFIFFIIIKNKLSSLLNLPTHLIIYLVPFVMFYVFSSWYEYIYVPKQKSKQIAVRNIINSYGGLALAVLFILYLHKDKYMGQIYALTIMGICFTFYYFYVLRPYIKFSFELKALKYVLSYSLPLIPYAICTVGIAQADRLLINKYCGPADVGLFSIAYSIGALLTLVLSSLSTAWTPAYYRHMKDKNYVQLDNDIVLIMKIIIAFAFVLILFGREIGMLLAKSNFHSALFIVPVIVVGLIIYSYGTFYSWHIQYAKKNIYMTPIVVVAGAVSISLNVIFIPRYGYVAAPFVSCVSYLTMLLMAIFVSKKILKLHITPILRVSKPLL
ncbi:MAG: oligosaccharide flippase family protein, partial [Thermoplasmata archaeon]|nr:oligosaccharide flippase family protein [Thermoplasmata archaeon]